MQYLADRAVNKGRQPEIDCLKAFCIFFMIFLHAFEELAEEATAVYHFITIVECLTGAGAFMLCMGIGTRYSRKQAPMDYLRRGFELLTVGQALNLARDAVPNLIACCKHAKMPFAWKEWLLRPGFAALVMGLVVYGLKTMLPTHRLITIAEICIGIGVYLVVSFLNHVITVEDLCAITGRRRKRKRIPSLHRR